MLENFLEFDEFPTDTHSTLQLIDFIDGYGFYNQFEWHFQAINKLAKSFKSLSVSLPNSRRAELVIGLNLWRIKGLVVVFF
jgi:hypothetical protein